MRIGIAIPTFSRDLQNGCLQRCLDSIQSQTKLPDIVTISASNCTESDVSAVLRESYSFPIRLQTSQQFQSSATNRNIAIDLLTECDLDIVSFFDSDDEMFSCRLEYIERAFQDSGCGYALHNYIDLLAPSIELPHLTIREYKIYPSAFLPDNRPYCGIYVRPELTIVNPYAAQGHVSVRKSLLSEYRFRENTNSIKWEDAEFVRRLTNSGIDGTYIYTPLAIYHHYPK